MSCRIRKCSKKCNPNYGSKFSGSNRNKQLQKRRQPAAAGACLPGLPTHLPQHSSVSREIVCCSCAFACCCTRKFCISAEAGFPCAAILPAGGRGEHRLEGAGGRSGGSGGGGCGGALLALRPPLWPNPRTAQQHRSIQSGVAGSARGRRRLRATALAWPAVTLSQHLRQLWDSLWRAEDDSRASIVDQ